MSKKIVGKENVDYYNKQNKHVQGVKLHLVYDSGSVKCDGLMTDNVYISANSDMYDSCKALPVGSEVNIYYNRWGTAESVVPCQQQKN